MKHTWNEVGLILVFAWLMILALLIMGLEPTLSEVVVIVVGLAALVSWVLLRGIRAADKRRSH